MAIPVTIHGKMVENPDGTVTITGTAEGVQAVQPIAPPGPSQGPVPPSGGSPEHPTTPPPGPGPHR